jgi:hypothetical protein
MHWLAAAITEVANGEAPMSEANPTDDPKILSIGTTMRQALRHRRKHMRVDRPSIEVDDAGYSAHRPVA